MIFGADSMDSHARQFQALDQGKNAAGHAAGTPQVTHKKPHLPTKICPVCNRPFAWRKKWEKVWEQVRYCSEACKKQRGPQR